MNSVYITGMGVLSPFGMGVDIMLNSMKAGQSAVRNMKETWERCIPDLQCWVGAPVSDDAFDSRAIPRKFRRCMGKTSRMAYYAVKDALHEAGITEQLRASGTMGVSFASTTGSTEALSGFFESYFQKRSLSDTDSGTFFKIMSHTSAANIAHAFGIYGRVISPCSACTSSTQSIGLGFETIRNGTQDIMLCGGSDELHPLVSSSFDLLKASSYKYNNTPERTPRPFDKDRDGTVCGAGAGCLVLESESSAKARGAKCIAQVTGFSTLTDASSMAQSSTESIVRCIRAALSDSGLSERDISFVNAHATGTLQGDAAEAAGIREVFGDETVLVNSLKGYIGHTTGASGVIELIACLKAMEYDLLLPVMNLESPSEDCKGPAYIQKRHTSYSGRFFLKNSFGFGGTNSVLVIRRCRE
ncbi:MAG: beta-ketoacyl-[acyl-carrier-protein] synthase family protein [Nitrospirae bacterium YQR-1]